MRTPALILSLQSSTGSADGYGTSMAWFSIAAPLVRIPLENARLGNRGSIMFEHSQDSKGMSVDITVRLYEEADERGWLRCSVLSFLETSYFDSVFRHKPRYNCPAIKLVAEWNDTIVGVIDVECEVTPGSVCTVCVDDNPSRLGGMIW